MLQTDKDIRKGIARSLKSAEAADIESQFCKLESRRLTDYISELMAKEFAYRKEARTKAREARKHRREAAVLQRKYDSFEYEVAQVGDLGKFGETK